MYHQANILFYKLRFFLAGLLAVCFLITVSALVTAIGAHSQLATGASASTGLADASVDTQNIVTDGAYGLASSARQALLSLGTDLYGGCRAITTASARSGRDIASVSAAGVHDVGSAIAVVGRGLGGAGRFSLQSQGKVLGSITKAGAVTAVIHPADSRPVPVITHETSAAILANLSAQQQQHIASLQAAQAVANRDLGGSIVAGDPNHGGYPVQWDDRSQDSLLDSWGMYNRECVSYTAWKVYQTFGYMPYWGGVGNANQWVGDARAAGIATGSTPQVHSVAISMRGYYGHAMWVEAVQGDMIYVSQYNYDLQGHYSEMWVSSSALTYVYFK